MPAPQTHTDASDAFCGAGDLRGGGVRITQTDGVITAVEPCPGAAEHRRLLIPALVNAHDHARPAMSSFGAADMPLELWLPRASFATPPDPHLAAAVSFARSARAGCGSVMVHYTRPSGRMDMIGEAREIARAAGDVGVRIAFALAVRDRNPLVYGDESGVLAEMPDDARHTINALFRRPPPEPRAYVDLVDAIAAEIAGPMVDVQYGPAGVQWCSRALLETIAERSAATGRRVHMHLLETGLQRAWADREFPEGVVGYLRDIGLLSPRLTLAHCVHATADELDMIAEAGATIVTNFSSNLHIRSGVAPIADAHRRGCAIAVGIDGLAFDEDDDALREMRLVQAMHGGWGFGRTWTQETFLEATVANGRRSVGAPGAGRIAPGEAADFAVLDLDVLDRDQIMPVDPVKMLFARGNLSAIREVVVAGRTIVRDGQPTGVDLDAMQADLRRLFRADRNPALEAAWPSYREALTRWYGAFAGCC
ncbi:amidohydrolase family protein [Terrihabitans rhizophilus]|uniref:Amidohydrolase family protein n=1 Tax=Terrihabitans rhizophilus TaxID=3092662 RepID=A0ABU4RM54_9HYPH|nr:amidohydrolase family protein [Terrihabitans sp. PJ23]MDX6805887.1 amidohydrolase family protein [Terrihabitans sp. PJ23]